MSDNSARSGSRDRSKKPPAGNNVQKIILDTDIGSDVDDVFALAFALGSPELDLIGITVVYGQVEVRAKLALKLLRLAGRESIPVALGAGRPMQTGYEPALETHLGHGVELSDVDLSKIVERKATSFLMQKIAEHPGQITAVAIGPQTNLGLLVRDHPAVFGSFKNVAFMGGSYQGVYARTVSPEYNFRCDPEAADAVISADIPTKMVGFNITKRSSLTQKQADELREINTPFSVFLAEAASNYMGSGMTKRTSTPMHDSMALAALVQPELFCWRPLVPRVQTTGSEAGVVTFTEGDAKGKGTVEVAVDADIPGFQNLFWSRIIAFARKTPPKG